MTNKTVVIGLVAVLVIAIGGYFFPSVTEKVTERVREGVGAFVGPDILDALRLQGGVTFDNVVSTSTTATSYTLLDEDIVNTRNGAAYSSIVMTPNTGALTLTFPASSTMSHFLPTAGEWAEQCWYNATGTAAATITFAAGTGIDLEVASSTAAESVSTLTLHPLGVGDTGCFRYFRKTADATSFDIGVLWTVYEDID